MARHMSSYVSYRKSCARLSTDPRADVCIVFVHGFFGNFDTTWEHFADMCDRADVPGADLLARSDLYFSDYGAEKDFVRYSASELTKFLDRLFPKPAMRVFGLLRGSSSSATRSGQLWPASVSKTSSTDRTGKHRPTG